MPAYAFGRAVGRPVILASRLPLDLPGRVAFEQPQAQPGHDAIRLRAQARRSRDDIRGRADQRPHRGQRRPRAPRAPASRSTQIAALFAIDHPALWRRIARGGHHAASGRRRCRPSTRRARCSTRTRSDPGRVLRGPPVPRADPGRRCATPSGTAPRRCSADDRRAIVAFAPPRRGDGRLGPSGVLPPSPAGGLHRQRPPRPDRQAGHPPPAAARLGPPLRRGLHRRRAEARPLRARRARAPRPSGRRAIRRSTRSSAATRRPRCPRSRAADFALCADVEPRPHLGGHARRATGGSRARAGARPQRHHQAAPGHRRLAPALDGDAGRASPPPTAACIWWQTPTPTSCRTCSRATCSCRTPPAWSSSSSRSTGRSCWSPTRSTARIPPGSRTTSCGDGATSATRSTTVGELPARGGGGLCATRGAAASAGGTTRRSSSGASRTGATPTRAAEHILDAGARVRARRAQSGRRRLPATWRWHDVRTRLRQHPAMRRLAFGAFERVRLHHPRAGRGRTARPGSCRRPRR